LYHGAVLHLKWGIILSFIISDLSDKYSSVRGRKKKKKREREKKENKTKKPLLPLPSFNSDSLLPIWSAQPNTDSANIYKFYFPLPSTVVNIPYPFFRK